MSNNLQQLINSVKGQFGSGGSIEANSAPAAATTETNASTQPAPTPEIAAAEKPNQQAEADKQKYQAQVEQNLQKAEAEKGQQELEAARRLIAEAAAMAAQPDSGASAASKASVSHYQASLNRPEAKKSDIKMTDFFAVHQHISESRKRLKQTASLGGHQGGAPAGIIHSEHGDEKGQTFNQN